MTDSAVTRDLLQESLILDPLLILRRQILS